MEVEWDEAKSERNFRERGFDFAYAALVFDGAVTEREDTRKDYGEPSFIVIGVVDGDHLAVVPTPREGRIRIVSARRASRRERHAYDQEIARRGPG
jgi:uncharacterized DUF497 family protein